MLSMRFDMPVAVNVGSVSCNSAVENSLLTSRSLVAKGEIIQRLLSIMSKCGGRWVVHVVRSCVYRYLVV